MDDILKFALAALLILIGSHLLLWSWLKRKIAAVQRDIAREREAGHVEEPVEPRPHETGE